MRWIWAFLGGFASGGALFYILGRRHGAAKQPETKIVEVTKTPDTTRKIVVPSIDDEYYDHDMDRKEVTDLMHGSHYILDDYDEIDLQNNIEEMDDYLCETEHPEDDDPEEERESLLVIDVDEFHTERHEYDKIRLYLDEDGSTLTDQMGNNYLDRFAELGYGREALLGMSLVYSEDNLYLRDDAIQTDYEIMFGGGDSE